MKKLLLLLLLPIFSFSQVLKSGDYVLRNNYITIGGNAWVEKAPYLGETQIWSLCVYNGKLYGGTYPNGKLYEWNAILKP